MPRLCLKPYKKDSVKVVSQLAILAENISQEDLNIKFLRSLVAEWNTHVVVWRNKPDLETISFDDLYNNFKIVEQEVKKNNLEQIHEDDLEEMDLKWQLALLSMRAKRYFQRTGKKITINGSDIVRYDKTNVECFICHKMGHFSRECRSPRNQESRPRNQDSSRKTVIVEDTSSKAMVAIDGAGFDWSYMDDNEVPTNMALMAFLDSEAYLHPQLLICLVLVLKSSSNLNLKVMDLRNFAPTVVLTKSGIVPISTVRQSSSRAVAPVSTLMYYYMCICPNSLA
nr:hypothetical protein [Tanacetum cinerariifolium]